MTSGPADGERVRTVFLGSGTFGAPALRRLAVHPSVTLVGVVTAPERPVGRRQALTPTPIGALAGELALGPILTPARLRAAQAVEAVLDLRPALVVLADYGQIVPRPLLELPFGALNLHPSLLPRHRGATPIPATILAGDTETGVTLMRMDEGLDTGPIVARARHSLTGTESAPELEDALSDEAGRLLGESLGPWLGGELMPTPQPSDGATLTRPLRRDDGRLDPARDAAALERQVRAYRPWPGTFVEAGGERLVVLEASVAPSDPADVRGRLVREGERPALATTCGRLVLEAVTPPGRRPMSGAAYLRGRPGSIG